MPSRPVRPPDGDYAIPGPRIGGMRPRRQQAQRPAVDEGVADVSLVVEHRTVDRGKAQLVAVIAYTGHDAVPHATGVEYAGGQFAVGHVGRPETQHVRAGDGTRRHPHHVPNHPADACIGAPEGFERRRMIVSLDFEGEVEVAVEGHYAGVVVERGTEPGWSDLLGNHPECGQQTLVGRNLDRPVHPRVLQADVSPERLVHAVLRPGLGQRLELGVGWIPSLTPEMIVNGPHLGEVEREQTVPAQAHQVVVRQTGQLHGFDPRLGRAGGSKEGSVTPSECTSIVSLASKRRLMVEISPSSRSPISS